MIGQHMVNRLYECQVVDRSGEKIGSVTRVWLDEDTGDPLWATVRTGLFGLKESFVPLQRAELREDKLRVPVDKGMVNDAPRIDADHDQMSDDEQTALYRHYGFGPQRTSPEGTAGQRAPQTPRRPGMSQQPGDYPGHSRRGATDRDAMTRSEEQLKVGTERVETGKVRLVKHVVTDEQQVTVPVSHEEVHIEREPITDANRDAAMHGQDIGEAEHEVSLHAEKPVVDKEAVPVERVRLDKDEVTDSETVAGSVRREEIDVEDDRGDRGRR